MKFLVCTFRGCISSKLFDVSKRIVLKTPSSKGSAKQEGSCFAHSALIVRAVGSRIKSCEPVNLTHSATTLLPKRNALIPNAKTSWKGNEPQEIYLFIYCFLEVTE